MTVKELTKLINEAGFDIESYGDGPKLVPSRLRVNSLMINTRKIGWWITDPARFPSERKDENIVWEYETEAKAILESGAEVNILIADKERQVIMNYETKYPEGY